MTRLGNIAYLVSTVAFVISGLAYSLQPRQEQLPNLLMMPGSGIYPLFPEAPGSQIEALDLPQLYLQPQNLLMWLLLISLWLMLALDAGRQLFRLSRHGKVSFAGQHLDRSAPVSFILIVALLAGALWPWLFGSAPAAVALGASAMLVATLIAATRASDKRRPAIGFLAGWSTGVATAALAALVAQHANLPAGEAAVLAILPGAVIGMTAQDRIGHSVSYSAALIWAFCALALTTMGSDPMIAISAILGIAIMAIVLIRAAS